MKALLLILSLLISIQYTFAQERITDLLSSNGDKNSSPSDFVEFRQKIFFQAYTESFGREIWVTNGNLNEASLLMEYKDCFPAPMP
jgi:ELWxxDGT repeat protein